MAEINIAAKLAELRAKKAAEAANAQAQKVEAKEPAPTIQVPVSGSEIRTEPAKSEQQVSTGNAVTQTIGTARTSEIDHMDFMSKLQELEEAIHTQHPKMPVLLMMIHKHLRADPELVTTLSEEEIGTIVNGLKVQTKTELVGTIAKQTKSRDKKTKLDADMF
jgi:hypothetical protein